MKSKRAYQKREETNPLIVNLLKGLGNYMMFFDEDPKNNDQQKIKMSINQEETSNIKVLFFEYTSNLYNNVLYYKCCENNCSFKVQIHMNKKSVSNGNGHTWEPFYKITDSKHLPVCWFIKYEDFKKLNIDQKIQIKVLRQNLKNNGVIQIKYPIIEDKPKTNDNTQQENNHTPPEISNNNNTNTSSNIMRTNMSFPDEWGFNHSDIILLSQEKAAIYCMTKSDSFFFVCAQNIAKMQSSDCVFMQTNSKYTNGNTLITISSLSNERYHLNALGIFLDVTSLNLEMALLSLINRGLRQNNSSFSPPKILVDSRPLFIAASNSFRGSKILHSNIKNLFRDECTMDIERQYLENKEIFSDFDHLLSKTSNKVPNENKNLIQEFKEKCSCKLTEDEYELIEIIIERFIQKYPTKNWNIDQNLEDYMNNTTILNEEGKNLMSSLRDITKKIDELQFEGSDLISTACQRISENDPLLKRKVQSDNKESSEDNEDEDWDSYEKEYNDPVDDDPHSEENRSIDESSSSKEPSGEENDEDNEERKELIGCLNENKELNIDAYIEYRKKYYEGFKVFYESNYNMLKTTIKNNEGKIIKDQGVPINFVTKYDVKGLFLAQISANTISRYVEIIKKQYRASNSKQTQYTKLQDEINEKIENNIFDVTQFILSPQVDYN